MKYNHFRTLLPILCCSAGEVFSPAGAAGYLLCCGCSLIVYLLKLDGLYDCLLDYLLFEPRSSLSSHA